MDIIVNTTSFIMGFLAGFGALAIPISYWFYRVNKETTEKQEKIKEEVKQEAEKMKNVADRMKRVQVITDMQNEMIAKQQEPSRGVIHSKNKNNIGGKIKELEQEKLDVLTSIIEDGYDPVVVAVDPTSGEQKQQKLSDYLEVIRTSSPLLNDKGFEPTTEEKKRKFKLITGDNSEDFNRNDDDNGGNPTFH